ncbi:1-deoxy-D-xylulose 5-phosphate reductoisomerase [Chitinophaga ginsengisegetis]|uniref:1-deoxy-D-xylulose 5-phosphate reductoisomerase n=1 Tax=Chitinophaga ginsengisegetis TaxID=393003 RepID=A0A1T5NHI3_9BACT|nr:1-deoxy-D-xylulose-5-phosphate reductoisomerase [Chitinophaga ginsengisegetis]MDR6569615.1 1-deoxy-D-xylulose-5-phosphate reductoisomerase [Chitinophaga ginsengisegetis]MDR6649348.1 1-deoxy-D-xylulose-5-phosphate reductoisomerase [Chitinophaga ginsengisegetis]MDR6655698.1 1-deoxy-D-xylulose-5-phosphate reductoisomerase [Chitinophaga ginsengisegetis]SKC99915.1 1-deoxy-D-xylulose 5-phosphate reductoisomerase [Chitinophaga ginsengisegetis]
MNKRKIAIFGSTGSIGIQALEVIAAHPDRFSVEVLTAQQNADLLIEQALKFKPNAVVIGSEAKYKQVKDVLFDKGIKVFAGPKAMVEVAAWSSIDMVLAAIMGFAGLAPTLSAIEQGTPVALANKETLVVAGDIVMATARRKNVPIIPVDSEHSAIFQCLLGEPFSKVEKVILTASGGPFLGKKPNFLINVKKDHALQHPNWSMGAKITIDSATLMNKGLEMIEARWLFGLAPENIEVVIHAQSIIHSMVQFVDGSLKAQMGLPDMKLPIQYALGYPDRLANDFPRFSFRNYPTLTFEQPDTKTFRNLAIAIEAMHRGGNAACVMNAANEEVVNAFLKNRIGFLQMTEVIEETLGKIPFIETPTLHDYYECDNAAREHAASLINSIVI